MGKPRKTREKASNAPQGPSMTGSLRLDGERIIYTNVKGKGFWGHFVGKPEVYGKTRDEMLANLIKQRDPEVTEIRFAR